MFETDLFLDILLCKEHNRRIKFEAPPTSEQYIIAELDGTKYKIRKDGKIWDFKNPCTTCDDKECFEELCKLSNCSNIYNESVSLCVNPLNNELLRMLCQWRKHIKSTYIEEQKFGSDKWKKTQICTSELTFLCRKTEIGGIIGNISMTDKHICSLSSLVSLTNVVKGLSVGFAVLITMYMDWTDFYTEENKIIVEKMLKKIKSRGIVGIDTYKDTPWYTMFQCIMERKRIPDKLKEYILSRAHLP
jgi:hypothetical protein